ncbi:SAM-dependent chlorinase/fluorinase, partial [Planococcus sp. SIMBA_160]
MSEHALVLQSDFGIDDGAVSAMYGVANTVSSNIRIFDLTHNIPQYDIWEASYRLLQTVTYWPEETVFVSVVDPGVGSERKSLVVKTTSSHYIITPDNGTLTHVAQDIG